MMVWRFSGDLVVIIMNEKNGTISLIPFINKEDIRKKARSKRERYSYLKEKVEKLVPWFYQQIEDESKFGEITVRSRDVAKEIGLENKSDSALYSGLRFTLFFEGLLLGMVNNRNENFFKIRKVGSRDGFPPSILQTLDNLELDGWQIKRSYDYMYFNHSLIEDRNGTYILESEGNIFFDRRSLTEEQALEFVKYMSSKDLRAPDFVYLTPINVVLTDQYLASIMQYTDFDVNKVGREFRIVKSDEGFIATSIYGKECSIEEFEIDSLIKGCSMYGIMSCFDRALLEEKIPERVDILKKIIPEIEKRLNSKNAIMIDGKKLVIANSIGIFHISLADGTLHKMYSIDGENGEVYKYKYICVGPVGGRQNSIIYNGARYDIDRTTGTVLSKMNMLLQEKYPDIWTRDQIMT